MAITQVQAKTGTATTGTTVTVTLSSATTAGNILVVYVLAIEGTTNPVVSGITLGGAADNFALAERANSALHGNCEIWADPNCAGGQTSVVVTFTAGTGVNTSYAVNVEEWSGIVPSSPVDVVNGQNSSGAATSAWSSLSSGTLSQASELVVGAVAGLIVSGTLTITGPGAPWTNISQVAPRVNNVLLAGNQVVSATTAQTYNGTLSSAGQWAAVIVTLKGTSAALPPALVPPQPPRRTLSRGIVQGRAVAPVIPVPGRPPPPPPRSLPPRRGITAGRAVRGVVPVQRVPLGSRLAPRRTLARAVVRFTPVIPPVNASPPSLSGLTIAAMDEDRLGWWKKRRFLGSFPR